MFLKRNIYRLYCRFRSIILSCANEYEISKIKYVGNPPRFAEGCVLHGKEFYELGSGCAFGKNSWVSCIAEYNGQKFSPKLKIGNNFSLAENCHIACINDSLKI